MAKRIRVYVLYPAYGQLSCRSEDYNGHELTVAAKSVKQAYYLAGNRIWAREEKNPTGILSEYVRNRGHRYYYDPDAPLRHDTPSVVGLSHGDGVRAIRRAMKRVRSELGPETEPGSEPATEFDSDAEVAGDLDALIENKVKQATGEQPASSRASSEHKRCSLGGRKEGERSKCLT